jgi:GNAT superfamily N-acetyltransferase
VSDRPEVSLRPLRAVDVAVAAGVLARAFAGFPALEIVVGHGTAAHGRLARLFELALDSGARADAVVAEVDRRIVGVLTHADSPDCASMSAARTLRFVRIAGTRLWSTLWMFSRIEKLLPRTPHRHLPTIGVDPPWQGSGIGERLIGHFSQSCDDASLEGYLETIRWSDPGRPSHATFYGRSGFVVADELAMTDVWHILTMKRPVGATAEAFATV